MPAAPGSRELETNATFVCAMRRDPIPPLLILWVATLGSDRIDLIGGSGPSALLPFQVLTAILVLAVWGRRLRDGRMPQVSTNLRHFAFLLLGLSTLVLSSLLNAVDFTISAGRATIFLGVALGVPLVVWGVSDRDDLRDLLARGARLGLCLALVFNALQAVNLLGGIDDRLLLGPVSFTVEGMTYGFLPRFAGTAYDQNRGAMVTLAFGVLVALGRPAMRGRTAWIALAAVMAALSLSRSAALAAIPALLFTPIVLGSRRPLRLVVAAACLVIAAGATLLLDSERRARTAEVLAPIAMRLDPSEGSARTHAALFGRALEVSTRDYGTLFGGIGFGMSYRVLADIQDGSRYGNFHSSWLQIPVESGIMALVLFGALVFLPLRRGGPFLGLLLGLAVFCVFYGFDYDPIFWITVALAWLTSDGSRHGASPTSPTPNDAQPAH